MERTVLARELVRIETPSGAVTVKRAVPEAVSRYAGVRGLRRCARSGVPLREVVRAALRAAEAGC